MVFVVFAATPTDDGLAFMLLLLLLPLVLLMSCLWWLLWLLSCSALVEGDVSERPRLWSFPLLCLPPPPRLIESVQSYDSLPPRV